MNDFVYWCPVCKSPVPSEENAYCYTCGATVKKAVCVGFEYD